jgi:hypothetical protein
MSHVFISYVREDTATVRLLEDDLEKAGVEVWLDRKAIRPGSRWKTAIRDAIRNGDFFIACFSKNYESKNKTYMNEELALAIEELRQYSITRAWFIPVLLTDCSIPGMTIGPGETLRDLQWVDLRSEWDLGIKRIVSVIDPLPLEVQHTLNALIAGDEKIREVAAEASRESSDPLVTQALEKALNDESKSVRSAATKSILRKGENGTRILVNALLSGENNLLRNIIPEIGMALLDHESPQSQAATALRLVSAEGSSNVRLITCETLQEIAQALCEAYKSDFTFYVKYEGRLGGLPINLEGQLRALDQHAGPLLRSFLSDQEPQVSAHARQAISAIEEILSGSWQNHEQFYL